MPYTNVSIGLIVFMGLAAGGMLSLVLMAGRAQHTTFSIILALTALLAVGGVIGSASEAESLSSGLITAFLLLILSFALGYALTTFSVLSPPRSRHRIHAPQTSNRRTAVIYLAPGEPPDYEVASTARRLELADDPQDVPGVPLRPFFMRDIKAKYSAIGRSPYREHHLELAQKVQARLEGQARVYVAFYNDQPSYPEMVGRAIEEGARRIIVEDVRVTDPPDPVLLGDLLEGLSPERYGATLERLGPLWDSDLLPQIYVRRVLEAVPQLGADPAGVGLLIVGRGHQRARGSSTDRRHQETRFVWDVRQALLKVGFEERQIAIGWLRDRPGAAESLQALIDAGARLVCWMPATFPADGLNTLYDIPGQINSLAKARGVDLVPLGAWNADDLAAEELATRVRNFIGTGATLPA